MALQEDVKKDVRSHLHSEVRNQVVEQFGNHPFGQGWSVEVGGDLQSEAKEVGNLHIYLLFLNLELTVVSPSLYFSANQLGDPSKNDKTLRKLLGLDLGYASQVVLVETVSENWVGTRVKMSILELVLDEELLAEYFCGLLGDLVMAQFESDFREIAMELMEGKGEESEDVISSLTDAVHTDSVACVSTSSKDVSLVGDQASDVYDSTWAFLQTSTFVVGIVETNSDT